MSAVIEDFVVPDQLPEDTPVTVSILIRNVGSVGARLDYYIDGNPARQNSFIMVEAGSTPAIVLPGAAVWVEVPFRYFPMPAWDYTLIATNYDRTSSQTRTILLVFGDIPTIITIVAPGAVPQGELFNIAGLLLRTDTNTPVPGAMIKVSYNGITLGNIFTDGLGRYLITTSIETSGTYTLKARFGGSSTLAASNSTVRTSIGTTIGTSPIIPIVVGAGVILYLISKK